MVAVEFEILSIAALTALVVEVTEGTERGLASSSIISLGIKYDEVQ